jgi:segregation and condensation protein A
MEDAYSIKLPLFEGPLDLLLHLIKEHKIDIYDIPIALITRQYLEYLKIMKELNLEIAGDFLVMAATLIHIKSRMLLPIEETADTEEPEDPRLELVMKLLEYQAFKDAAMGLQEMEEDRSGAFSRKPAEEEHELDEGSEPALFELNMYDLINSFKRMLERAPEEIQAITRETLTIKDKMSMIIEALQYREAMRFEELFMEDVVRSHFIVTFVALLELIRLGLAKIYQEKDFGVIWVISPDAESNAKGGALNRTENNRDAGQDREAWEPEAIPGSEAAEHPGAGIELTAKSGLPEKPGLSAEEKLPAKEHPIPKSGEKF